MEDYLKIINDNNAQMWFDEPDRHITNMKRESTFSNGYLEDSNMLGLPKREDFEESQLGADNIGGNFNFSGSFLSQIPPHPEDSSSRDDQLACLYEPDASSSNAWEVPLSSYFDFSVPNQHEVQPRNSTYYEYPEERAHFEQTGYEQQWYNTCNQVPTPSEPLQQEFHAFSGLGQGQPCLNNAEPAVVNTVTPVKASGGEPARAVHVPRHQATPGCVQKKKRFFQVLNTPNNNKSLSQLKTMMTPNTRIIKILHTGSQEKTQQINKNTNRVPPIKIWKDGTTSRYMTTVMSLCGETKNIYHHPRETQPQSSSEMQKTSGLGSKTFAPTSAVMVTTEEAAKDDEDEDVKVTSSPEASAPSRPAILPASLPHVGKSPVQPPAVFKNTIYGYKKLKYRCNACAYRQATLGSLITHVKAHGFPYCVLCALVLATPKQLGAHVRKAHPSIELPDMVTVTSKYGRKRHVLSSVAFAQNRLYPKRQTKNEKEEDQPAKKGNANSQKSHTGKNRTLQKKEFED